MKEKIRKLKVFFYKKLGILYCPTHFKRLIRKGINVPNMGVRCPKCAHYKQKIRGKKMKCKMCKKERKINEYGYCKKCQKTTDNMKCEVCDKKLILFIGNPNKKKKKKVHNFCSIICAEKARFLEV